jgi:hypothetical protein
VGALDRVRKLEDARKQGRQSPQEEHEERLRRRLMTRHLHAIAQARRRLAGLIPEDDLPYTVEDRENDRRFLEEGVPKYRERPGWQREEGREILDRWEQNTRERLAKGARSDEQEPNA